MIRGKYILITAFFIQFMGVFPVLAQEELKDKVYLKCLSEARKTMSEGASRYYCTCYSDQVYEQYANAHRIPSEDTLKSYADSCIVKTKETYLEKTFLMVWDPYYQNSFLESCISTLKGSSIDAEVYCNCALEKIMILYPDPQAVYTIPEEVMDKIAIECLEEK